MLVEEFFDQETQHRGRCDRCWRAYSVGLVLDETCATGKKLRTQWRAAWPLILEEVFMARQAVNWRNGGSLL